MKYAVVTFLFNKYDLLRQPLHVDENADYYCITDDKNLKDNVWKCIYVERFDTNTLMGTQKTYMAKYSFYEYIPDNYDYFVTIDASIEIAESLEPIINLMRKEKYDIGLSMHNYRSVWNEEYDQWVRHRNLDRKYVDIFNRFAKSIGFNADSKTGLIECTMKIYKNTPIIKLFIQEVYNTLSFTNHFEDKNDQCYLTCVFGRYKKFIKTLYFCRQLYCNSKFFNLYYHNTNRLCRNEVTVERNPNFLFGENVNITKF